MPKFYYKPILEKIQEVYLVNAEEECKPRFDIEANIRIVIEAESESDALGSMTGFVDVRMWELEETIESPKN